MLESIRVTEKLRWPEQEFAKKSVLDPGDRLIIDYERNLPQLSPGILKDIFTTGTSSYNVLLQSKEKRHNLQKQSPPAVCGRHQKPTKSPNTSESKESAQIPVPVPFSWVCPNNQPPIFLPGPLSSNVKFPHALSVSGTSIGLPPRPKSKAKRHYFSSLLKPKPPQLSKSLDKGEFSGKKLCILTAIKPTNVEKEKLKFFKSDFTYNPQFEYASPVLTNVLAKHSQASDRFLKQAISIMERALKKYRSYENFEQATGGSLLPRSRIWGHVRKYMLKEGCLGEIVVHLTEDLLSRASMTVVSGCPTLTINVGTAREHWLEGMLRHEIGTHYFRGLNNTQQPWGKWNERRRLGLKPINPTEEGLASLHSVLLRKDPFLWRAALLYYTVYQASQMSFSELFQNVGKFVQDPNTRWDYCVRAKRGWTDTSQPGCFSKDQVYLDGILQLLRYRDTIDFCLLTALGKVSYEDVERLKEFAVLGNIRVPHFLQDHARYLGHLEKIMEVNELSDKELRELIF
ncbi:uncharacterized protein KIAA0895 homolog [Tachyglossus aculeatus]|uniref:uncharacterized protein KIAA0895 homolog n=1 Tax=Tachyglossus aculeatus TaxID=9261 RepID=UPI0018F293DE|nr:uncharacterized protein KIAA0895 homolog [Tachyglossus aculeatus]